MPMAPYRTPWEFVAERFHCRQTYLHTGLACIAQEFHPPRRIGDAG